MKNNFYFAIIICVLINVNAISQNSLTLRFTAEFSCEKIQIDSVKIRNNTLGVDTMIYYPDTALVISMPTSIKDYEADHGFHVSQNFPNPFVDKTSFTVSILNNEEVTIQIFDITGRSIIQNVYNLQTGNHQFDLNGVHSNVYYASVKVSDNVKGLKMISVSPNRQNIPELLYVGKNEDPFQNRNINSNFSYNYGNLLLYTCYVTSAGNSFNQTLSDSPNSGKTYTFKFNLAGCACVVGQTGPSGGFTFWCNGNNGIEAAPVDTEISGQWGPSHINVAGTSSNIGTGMSNTMLILQSYLESQAAKYCADLISGGKDDWFLPSKDELNQMYQKLKQQGIGGFANQGYWSSTQYSQRAAWWQNFGNGVQMFQEYEGQYSKSNPQKVRCVRAF
jgi:hypothetical protein